MLYNDVSCKITSMKQATITRIHYHCSVGLGMRSIMVSPHKPDSWWLFFLPSVLFLGLEMNYRAFNRYALFHDMISWVPVSLVQAWELNCIGAP